MKGGTLKQMIQQNYPKLAGFKKKFRPNSYFGIDNCIYKFTNMQCFEKDFSKLALLFS